MEVLPPIVCRSHMFIGPFAEAQRYLSLVFCVCSSHSEMADRRTRRNAVQAVSYKEPSLGKLVSTSELLLFLGISNAVK